MFKTDAEKAAEEFVESVKALIKSESGLIYGIESNVGKRNVISPSTIGDREAWVEVTLYNVSDPDRLFGRRKWQRLGEMGADVDTHTGDHYNGYNPTIEFYKKFSG